MSAAHRRPSCPPSRAGSPRCPVPPHSGVRRSHLSAPPCPKTGALWLLEYDTLHPRARLWSVAAELRQFSCPLRGSGPGMASLPQSLAEASLPSRVCLGKTGQTPDHPDPPCPPPTPRQDPGDSDSQARETPFVWPAWQRGRGQLWLPLGWGEGLTTLIPGAGHAPPPGLPRAQVHDCHQDKSNIIKFQSAE